MKMTKLLVGKEVARTPVRRRASDLEHRLQVQCVRWFRYRYPKLVRRFFAIPNGGYRTTSTAVKMKAEGVLAGVSDLILLCPRDGYSALLIEMKTKDGRQSEAQLKWQEDLIKEDEYKYVVCRSFDEFQQIVTSYLDGKKREANSSLH